MTTNAIRLDEAAQLLGVSKQKLYAELRRCGVLGSANIVTRPYQRSGEFQVEYRGFNLPGTDIQRQYAVTLVTPAGMPLLQEIADAITTGTVPPVPSRPAVPALRHSQRAAGQLCHRGLGGRRDH